jgi:hypothetical protein
MSKSYNVRAKCKEMFQNINVNPKKTFPWKFFELMLISSTTFLDQPFRQVKHLEKLCCVCGRHLMSINFPPRKFERILCLLLKDGSEIIFTYRCKTFPLLRNKHKSPPIHTPHDLHRFGS